MSMDSAQTREIGGGIGPAARRWWASLQDFIDGRPNRGRDRAARARLRRASSPIDALDEPLVFDLCKRLGFAEDRRALEWHLPRVAVIAAVLAHVRPAEGGPARRLAEMLGQGDPPPMSPLRFKRLLAAQSDGDILIQFRRAVALVGNKGIEVADLAESLLHWNSDRRRMRWAFDYYGASFAAPRPPERPKDDEDQAQ